MDHFEVPVDLGWSIEWALFHIGDVVHLDIPPVLELEEVDVYRLIFALPICRHLNTRMDLRPSD